MKKVKEYKVNSILSIKLIKDGSIFSSIGKKHSGANPQWIEDYKTVTSVNGITIKDDFQI